MEGEKSSFTRWYNTHSVRNVFYFKNDTHRCNTSKRRTVKWEHVRKVCGKRNDYGKPCSKKNTSVGIFYAFWYQSSISDIEEKSHILIKLSFFGKNVWKCHFPKNIRTTLKLFLHFALENNFLINTLQCVFLHCCMLACRVHPTGYSEANLTIPYTDIILD